MADFDDLAHMDGEEEALLQRALLGDHLERALNDPTSPFSAMMAKARDEYIAAVRALIQADLHSPDGLTDARRVQAHALRYQDLCRWISNAMDEAGRADEALADVDGTEEPAIQELMEQRHGKRGKPAFDA